LADNALGASSWWIDDVGHPDREAMDEFNRTLVADATFDVAAVPVREGLLIARKRST
jgi:predicted O-methyltransferase YrrM